MNPSNVEGPAEPARHKRGRESDSGSESLGRAIRAESESRVIHSEESVNHA
jgi:hypothetical protein